jgi:hypothetical protein
MYIESDNLLDSISIALNSWLSLSIIGLANY